METDLAPLPPELIHSTTLPLPLLPGEISAGWIQSALRIRYPEVVVQDCAVATVIPGTSTKIRVHVRYAEGTARGLPPTMIVKGGFEAHSPSLAWMYANEARFYALVQPDGVLESPTCYFAGSDPGTHQSIVVLEDLDAAGVHWLHAQRPQAFDAVALRMRALAAFHARYWASPDLEPGGRLDWAQPRVGGWGMDFCQRYLKPDVWASYMARPRGAAVSIRLHDRDRMERALWGLVELEANTSTPCLGHGDTHLGNLYITAEGRPGFLDAQVVRTHWSIEISYHLVCAIDMVDRPAWEERLLVIYLEGLAAAGVEPPSFKRALFDYQRGLAYGLFIFLTNQTEFQTEAVNTAYAARFANAALTHGTLDLF